MAQHLATLDFTSLPSAQGYKQQAIDEVYQRVVISFGKKSAAFHLKMGESPIDYLPEAVRSASRGVVPIRRNGASLTDLLRKSEVKGKKEKSEHSQPRIAIRRSWRS